MHRYRKDLIKYLHGFADKLVPNHNWLFTKFSKHKKLAYFYCEDCKTLLNVITNV